ncbi:hypothetical protein C2S52_001293 [Perilla frutescens var. hirtella]|nr:hypothetical protein C2S52_001293 [Perilla frutescens var. hirtella]
MYELYCKHAREVGFGVRKNTQKTNSIGQVIEKYYVCSNEGVKKKAKVDKSSNQDQIIFRQNNITCTDCKAFLRVKKNHDGMLEGHMNFVNRMRMSVIEAGDAQTLIDRLCQEGVEDGVFLYRCAFILDEKTETFQWLFEVFKKLMKMKCPVIIFTDQDLAITSALSKVFLDARHRLCIWHLYQNAISHFGKLKGNRSFNEAFQRCLSRCMSEEEFESCWNSMINNCNLEDNS